MKWTTRLACVVMVGSLGFQTACGTLFYPERRGQERGQIDPTVAILNGLGLLLFLVPGIIAFAVDFHTGAIYLPPDEETAADGQKDMRIVHMDPDTITPETLAAVIEQHTGKQVTLTEQDIEVMRLGKGDLSKHLAEVQTN